MSLRMDAFDKVIETIATAADAEGLPALSKRSGVPYTTLIDWQKAGWRPKAIQTFEKVAAAASPESKAA